MVVALQPLHEKYKIKRVVVSTYQSVTGTGKQAVDQLFKERNYNVLQKIKTAQKRLIEMKRNITSMSQITKDIETDIIDMVSLLSNEQIKQVYDKNSKIKEWWDLNITFDDTNTHKLTSTEIWSKFKKNNKEFIDKNELIVEDFKNYIKTFIDVKSYNEKSKKGSIELVGFKFIEVLVQESENVVVELSIPTSIKQKKCVFKKAETNKKMLKEDA